HVRLRFSDPAAYQSAASALGEVTLPHPRLHSGEGSRVDEALALQIPSDGSQRELRAILDWLDAVGIEADELTVHTPDLDDVFFALTASTVPSRPTPPKETVR
ncbi:ABC transporter, partial [Streptomyces sp. NPDC000229]